MRTEVDAAGERASLETRNHNETRVAHLQHETELCEAHCRKYGMNLEQARIDQAMESQQMSNISKDFFGLFLFSLVVISAPIKNFAYVLPPLYLLAQLLWLDKAAATRTLLLLAFATLISCVSLLVDTLRGQVTNLPGVFVGIVTFLPLFMMVGERFDRQIDDALFQRISRAVAWFVILQAAIGVVQLAISGNPDAVTGTLGLLDFHLGSITITQVYFGFLMLSMVLFLMLDYSTWLAKAGILAGLVASALSQSGHQTVFLAVALGLFAVLQFPKFHVLLGAGCPLALLVALVLSFYPTTISNARQWYDKTVNDPDSPKRLALKGARSILADPKNLMLGAGIGQYSSRAALITSGEYSRLSLPSLLVGKSDYYRRHLQPGLDFFEERGEGSAISKPYFSWLTIATEFGVAQLLAISVLVLVLLQRCVRLMYASLPEVARAGMLMCTGLTFFLLCCTVENYVEFPQAVFVPYLLFAVALCSSQQKLAVASAGLRQECCS